MRRPWNHLLAPATMLALTAMAPLACEDEETLDDDDVCVPGDPHDGLNCECTGDDCICPSTGDCAIYCVDECSLQCAGSGNCEFLCVDDCVVACTGSGNCDSEVGPGSSVSCTGSGDCDVVCTGDCSVACPGSATCTVHCTPEATCTLENCSSEVHECAEDISICNGACP